jgi:hypothetical protein
MLYITTPPMMIEPATASIAVYLLVKTPETFVRNRNRIIKRPFHYKRKICKWVLHNHHMIADTIIDETNDYLLDMLNIIKIINYNPSIFVMIYIIAILLILIF